MLLYLIVFKKGPTWRTQPIIYHFESSNFFLNFISHLRTNTVKVDNWGTFFLQKLQNFFNKTDYCDLTLQFLDNSQLKVHRLVLSACTGKFEYFSAICRVKKGKINYILDYFNMLEQSCEMVEDILIMPNDLQADVIVPIVNFMYTGTLEFHYNMYEKLLKTSREMNMTVLSKLLEAHRQTSTVYCKPSQPILLNKNASTNRRVYSSDLQGKVYQKPVTVVSNQKTVVYKQGQTIIKHMPPGKSNIPEPIQIVTRFQQEKNASRPARFIVPDEAVQEEEEVFENLSYESKPLLTASQLKREEENSPFESLRKGYTNKRQATGTSLPSPPSKKPNLDDIKAEAEAQRQRGELASGDDESKDFDDDDDDPDYDADQYFEDNESDDEISNNNQKGSTSTVVKSTTKQITVNDCSGGNVDHAKILSEVLKKYPHLVKNPKNIKLKIMQKPSHPNSQQTTAIVRVVKTEKPAAVSKGATPLTRSTVQTAPSSNQPKKIDAKTMHELIRMGAENMKGPWLCLECGSGGRPISIPTYKKFRAHLINVHKQKIDPRICEHCGLKSTRRVELVQHQLMAHNIDPPPDVQMFRCSTRGCVFVTQKEDLMIKHKREIHKEFQQKCSYCSKVFGKEFLLHAHMRAVHRHNTKSESGVEYSEDEEYVPAGTSGQTKKGKIEILSNIELPVDSVKFEVDESVISHPSSEAEALESVASGIATSLGLVDNANMMDDQYNIEQQLAQVHGEYAEPKKEENAGVITRLVAEDGTELQLTVEQKNEILQQLQSQGATLSDNVVMVLDQSHMNVESNDNNIMVMYSEPQGSSTVTTTSTTITTIKPEELEKAEIVFENAPHVEEENDDKKHAETEKSKLIADLEGDWTEEDESSQTDKKPTEKEPQRDDVEQFSMIASNGEKSTTDEKPVEEVNEKLKDILDDWENTSEISQTDGAPNTSEISIEADADIKIEDQSIETEKSTDEGVAEVIPEPPQDFADKTEEDIKEPVIEESPIAKSSDDDSEESKKSSEQQKAEVSSERSKLLSNLLEEWSDGDDEL